MNEQLLHTYDILAEYESRFNYAEYMKSKRKPWEQKDRIEIANVVKEVLGFQESFVPQITIIDEKKEYYGSISVKHCLYRSWNRFYGNFSFFSPEECGIHPLIFVCPGHGKEGRLTKSYQRLAFFLAKKGAYVILNDNIGQGSRSKFGHNDCVTPFYCGLTLQAMIVAETIGLINYAKNLSNVDYSRIGACGNSGGGTLTMFLSALAPALSALASSGYPSSLSYILQKERKHCACNIFRHFAGRLDMWEIYSLFAPKPLMIHQGMHDSLIPVEFFQKTATKLQIVYSFMDVQNNFDFDITDTKHSWEDDDLILIGNFFEKHFGLNTCSINDVQDYSIPIEYNNVVYPCDAISTDELAEQLTGVKAPNNIKLEEVFIPTYQGKPIQHSEIVPDLGRGNLMRVFAQFEASL